MPHTDQRPSQGYANYVLGVLLLVYILNFIDRQILSILAGDIKRDLHLGDDDIGFLYGTAFGVFYSLFGIPLGRLADNWNRVRLIAIGLALWSSMTALSGLARTGVQLSLARVGVGIGEATASPCAYSLLSDYFPRDRRATALAIYSSGIFIGGGLSLSIGGLVVANWNAAFPGGGPFGLVGWQAAFMAVGVPGLLLALWVSTLREPVRGLSDGIVTPTSSTPFSDFFGELVTIIPPFTLIGAARRGAGPLAINLAVAAATAGAAMLLILATHSIAQWAAVGLGAYAVFSWGSALRARDPATFRLIWQTPAFLYVTTGYGLIAFVSYGIAAFGPLYAESVLHESKQAIGFWLGGGAAVGGFLGIVTGGRWSDALRKRRANGRILVVILGAVGPVIPVVIAYTTSSATIFYAMSLLAATLAPAALGAAAATSQDLVLPRMRGTATATFFIGTALVGLALGPYTAGFVSKVSGSLSTGVLSILAVAPVSVVLLLMAMRAVPDAEASMIERARAAGEPV